MSEGQERQRRSRANRGFVIVVVGSLFLHTAAVGAVLYNQHSRPAVVDVRDAIPVQLVALGKKRDPKLLPRKVQEAVAAAPEDKGIALDKNSEPVDPNKKPGEKKPEKKLSNAAERLLEGRDSKLEEALDKLDEREGDPDGDIHGTTTDNTNAAAGYQRAIIKALQTNYRLPETIPSSQRQFLKAQVLLYIENDGTISKYEFAESHPNEMFMGALDALLKSIKLPPPPASEAKSYADNGVLVIFRP